MRNLSGVLGENSCAQLTMNSSASSSRSFSMNGEGTIELKSWFMSRSFRLMVCGCPVFITAVCDNEKLIRISLLSSVLDFQLIVDNYVTHKHPKVRTWLAQRPRYHMHYTPAYSSWLNQVERWFGLITQRAIRRGSFTSVKELVQKIDDFVQHYNRK